MTTGGGEREEERSSVGKCLSLIPICNYYNGRYNLESLSTSSSPYRVTFHGPFGFQNFGYLGQEGGCRDPDRRLGLETILGVRGDWHPL